MKEESEKKPNETETEVVPQLPTNTKLWRGLDEGEKFGRFD